MESKYVWVDEIEKLKMKLLKKGKEKRLEELCRSRNGS